MDLKVKKVQKPAEMHYTILEVRKLHNKINGWGIRNIQECLGSIYRVDLREGKFVLKFNDNEIQPPFTPTDDSFLKRVDGSVFRVPVSTTIGKKKVSGYLGVLAPGIASRKLAGFAVVRRGRCVQGWLDSWKPEEIFGQDGRNDLVNQRLTGELVMDEFAASHTKDAIVWSDDDESKLTKYLIDLANTHELIYTAKNHRGTDSTVVSKDDFKAAIGQLKREFGTNAMIDAINIEDVPPPELLAPSTAAMEKLAEGETPPIHLVVAKDTFVDIVWLDGHENDPYYTYVIQDGYSLKVLINKNHPAFADLLTMEAIEAYSKHCAFDAIAEWKCRMKSAEIRPESVKLLKDHYFRVNSAVSRSDS